MEYAQKAVDNSGTVIALRGKNGIVTAVDKVVTSKMFVKNANPRVFNANDQIGMTFCGTYPDCRSLKVFFFVFVFLELFNLTLKIDILLLTGKKSKKNMLILYDRDYT